MNSKSAQNKGKSPAEIWRDFIQAELKANSNIGKIFEKSGFGGYDDKSRTLTLYFADEASNKSARGQIDKVKNKLNQQRLLCDRIDFNLGEVPKIPQTTAMPASLSKTRNPQQALIFAEFGQDKNGKELSQPVLAAAVKAEANCNDIYDKLKRRTEQLAGNDGVTISVSFNWRMRVGGTRGFRELLLPVFHPVFGVPYIPSSSLKGAARAWAKKNCDSSEVLRLLGILEGNSAIAAKVEFLDAFPTQPCLSVDVATPQWHWNGDDVNYQPEPHPLLSLEQASFLLGLCPAAKGNSNDVKIVKEWLENALKTGIGSRVSSGYGRALGQVGHLHHSKSYDFQLWTQGMYGIEPPAKSNHYQGIPEFRPTAVRGILRYWFRSVALKLYGGSIFQTLEDEIFGKLSQQGKVSISVLFNPSTRSNPYCYTGKICLEATDKKYLSLLEKLLILASHLGGVGRGSRRNLHLLNGMMRGCHWGVDGSDFPFDYNLKTWKLFFQQAIDAFKAIKSPIGDCTSSPGQPKCRQQDVLDKNAQVWLLKSSGQIPPDKVTDWQKQGIEAKVRGSALTLLYGNDMFKGKNRDNVGNPHVGGELGTPSYVWIKSIFPASGEPYQVVTIFGVSEHKDRLTFAKALQESGAELVFGEMPSGNSPPSPKPKLKR